MKHRQQKGGPRGEGSGRRQRVKGVKYMVPEGDWTLSGEHTKAYTGDDL